MNGAQQHHENENQPIQINIGFVDNGLAPEKITNDIILQQTQPQTGAASTFIGQVRADEINGKRVTYIDYTLYPEMAEPKLLALCQEISQSYAVHGISVFHSVGWVRVGEVCLYVRVSARHRKNAIQGCEALVELIKKELPVWGKEIFEDESAQWKVNT